MVGARFVNPGDGMYEILWLPNPEIWLTCVMGVGSMSFRVGGGAVGPLSPDSGLKPTSENWVCSVEKTALGKVGPDPYEGYGSPLSPERDICTIPETGVQNKVVNYHNQTMTENIRMNRDSEVDYISQWTLKGIPHPGIVESDNISELSKTPGQNPSSICCIGILAWH